MTDPARPLCSVIMPAFNCEAVLPSAIECVLDQSEPRIELIVIDDASTDATHAVARRYERVDPRIVVLRNARNSRRGPIEWEPRNDGLRVARGELIAYLDADNTWRPDFVARLSLELLDNPTLQLTFCDSCNHYAANVARSVADHDPRKLVDCGPTWTVFSLDELDRSRLGVDQYIDTNELMHRASVFARLRALWRIAHPRRHEVSRQQYSLRPGRRHNDLDLVERIIDTYGVEAVSHVRDVLVDYYYPSAERSLRPAPRVEVMHPQTAQGLASIIVDRLYGHPVPPAGTRPEYDLGVGEIRLPGLSLTQRLADVDAGCRLGERLTVYRGSSTVLAEMERLAQHCSSLVPGLQLGPEGLVCFDGCHEALGAAIDIFTGTTGNSLGRDAVAFPVPSYPYWTIAAAGRHRGVPLDARSGSDHVAALASLAFRDVGAIVVNWPNSPLGYTYGAEDVKELNRLARRCNWGIVADITYGFFLEAADRATIAQLAPERTILCDSASKAWGIPGLRFGWAFARNARLAAAMRAYKSARTLLTSSVKVALFEHLMRTSPDIPRRIVSTVHERRARLRRSLAELEPELELAPALVPGLYEVIGIDGVCDKLGETPEEFVSRLLRDAAILTSPDSTFFPPGHDRGARGRFLRMSWGRCSDAEGVAARLSEHIRASSWVAS